MKFRRQVLVATIVMGCGFWSFQLIVRSLVEARLSSLFNATVHVGSFEISLLDGIIAFNNIEVHPKLTVLDKDGVSACQPTIIAKSALKFDWNSAAYRNIKIDKLVASGMKWQVNAATVDDVPFAENSNNQSIWKRDSSSVNTKLDTDCIHSMVMPINRRIAEESANQNRLHADISSRLKSIRERLDETVPNESTLNVLRHKPVIEDVKKGLSSVRQSIAENRISRKESDKQIASIKQSVTQRLAEKIDSILQPSSVDGRQTALQIAESVVASDWNRNRTIVHTLLNAINVLQSNECDEPSSEPASVRDLDFHPLRNVPIRFTRVESARIRGQAQFRIDGSDAMVSINDADSPASFELNLHNLSSESTTQNPKPHVSLTLEESSTSGKSHKVVCVAERIALAQSASSQVQIFLERSIGDSPTSATKIQHAELGWSATVTLPLIACLDSSYLDPAELAKAQLNLGANQVLKAKLIGTTPTPRMQRQNLLIEIEPECLAPLELVLTAIVQTQSNKLHSELKILGTELVSNELITIGQRWDQLGDEHARAHTGWETDMAEMNERVQRFELLNRRIARDFVLPPEGASVSDGAMAR
ncbi:MAG: hypothetical protein NTU79_19325 [Planctomycetota bacterium]|nr:hypothetical protein [Planctomycetota bacterium]